MAAARAYFLTTTRLGFDLWSPADAALAQDLWGDPQVTASIGGPFSDREIGERLLREIASMTAYQAQYWPIFLLEDGGHVGCAGLRPYRLDEGIYEIGFHLRPAYWGRGLAEEAGRAVAAFAFESLAATALFAGHHPANLASSRVLAKLGFQFMNEEFYAPTGLMHPSYLLRRDAFEARTLPLR
ncbi:MAG: GNAT family N-acetyltransferase [Bryobacteraceae bacterium]|jgi:RimJ/RimL family protein N-acetyltransferase